MAQMMKRPRLKAINLLNDFKIIATFIDDSQQPHFSVDYLSLTHIDYLLK